MTDLDFDELDRAVNSLIASAPKTPDSDENKENVLTLEDTIPETDSKFDDGSAALTPPAPILETPQEPAVIDEPELPSTPLSVPSRPLAAKRSSGRFMDVVHPSSDMRSTTPAPTNGFGAKRPSLGLVIPTDIVLDPKPQVAQKNVPELDPVEEKEETNEWPDPLDFGGLEDGNEDTATPVAPTTPPVEVLSDDDDDIDDIANDITSSMKADPEQALDSPFLADAKVAKRPLGAFSNETATEPAAALTSSPVSAPAVVSAVAVTEPPIDLVPPAPESEAAMPEEFQSDLLSIEAGITLEPTPAAVITPTDVQPAPAEIPTGPTAITQQYKEEPSSGDKESGSIFDTKSYHKALSHPAKKKASWKIIVAVICLAILGVGIALGVYYYVLPMLK